MYVKKNQHMPFVTRFRDSFRIFRANNKLHKKKKKNHVK